MPSAGVHPFALPGLKMGMRTGNFVAPFIFLNFSFGVYWVEAAPS